MRLVVLCCLLLVGSPLMAGEARDRLDRFFAEVETLKADFSQTVSDENGQVIQESAGTVLLLRPGRFRWNYEKPFKQLIVADGQFLWTYDAELAQATVKPLAEALGASPIMLLAEPRPLTEDFVVVGEREERGLQWVDLTPKVHDTDFDRIRIGLDARGIREMHLSDHFGQQTVIVFDDLELNGQIPASRFRFTVPAGVDVIGTTNR